MRSIEKRRLRMRRLLAIGVCALSLLAACTRPKVVETIVYGAADDSKKPATDWEREANRVRERLQRLGVKGATVEHASDRIDVGLPAMTADRKALVESTITTRGRLEFIPAAGPAIAGASDSTSGQMTFSAAKPGGAGTQTYKVDRASALVEPVVARAQAVEDKYSPGVWTVHLEFSKQSGDAFEALTAANVGRPLLIVLDGELKSAPVVMDKIAGGNVIISMGAAASHEKALADASALASALQSGVLPFPLVKISDVPL